MTAYSDYGDLRIFECDVDPEQLIWHRDKEDRTITVIEGTGWQFQFDDQLPFELKVGSKVAVAAMIYHRILKGQNRLVINIQRTGNFEETP